MGKPQNDLEIDENFDQKILNIFKYTFQSQFADNDKLNQRIQKVKNNLYSRDFVAAFNLQGCEKSEKEESGTQEQEDKDEENQNLIVYTMRWSPSRALMYSSIAKDIGLFKHLTINYENGNNDLILNENSSNGIQVTCIGGGAGGEVVAFALQNIYTDDNKSDSNQIINKIVAIDLANWGNTVLEKLQESINKVLYENSKKNVKIEFIQENILNLHLFDKTHNGNILETINNSNVITILFTMGELFLQSKANTVVFLNLLGDLVKTGTRLLIVESAGSYSEIKVGNKKFPLHFLLDYTLTKSSEKTKGNKKTKPKWELIDKQDSKWFRLSENLTYPLKLENSRYMYRYYERI